MNNTVSTDKAEIRGRQQAEASQPRSGGGEGAAAQEGSNRLGVQIFKGCTPL
jgi:hypothetical protein